MLKRGEKYEQIFNTILNWTIHDGSFIPVKELINLEQKYFPEPIKKTITIDKDLLPDLAKEITKCFREWIKDHLVRDLPITPENLAILSDSIIKGIENSVKNIKEGD